MEYLALNEDVVIIPRMEVEVRQTTPEWKQQTLSEQKSGRSVLDTNSEFEFFDYSWFITIHKYGPFRPNVPVLVPLWLALILSQRGECTVKLGERFCSDYISSIRKQERDDASSFQVVTLMSFCAIEMISRVFHSLCLPYTWKSLDSSPKTWNWTWSNNLC